MAKIPADITLTLKARNGHSVKLELTHLSRGKCYVRRNGRRSNKVDETTPTQIGRELGRWLSKELPKVVLRSLCV